LIVGVVWSFVLLVSLIVVSYVLAGMPLLAVVLASVGWSAWRIQRLALVIRPDGVEVRNLFRTVHLKWPEISRVVVRVVPFATSDDTCLVFLLRDTTAVRSIITIEPGRWAASLRTELARHVPFEGRAPDNPRWWKRGSCSWRP
jgi:hypothetical protein